VWRRGRSAGRQYGFSVHVIEAGSLTDRGRVMAARKAFALRIDEDILAAMARWANDDLRSLNAQIEFVLRESLRKNSRLKKQEKQ